MKAIIPCAGFGTRLAPLTNYIPKEMAPLGLKPAIDFAIQECIDSGITEIYIVSRAEKDILHNWMSNWKDKADICGVYQGDLKGLGGAILAAALHFDYEPAAVILPDEILLGISPATKFLKDRYRDKTILGSYKVQRDEVSKYGILEVKDDKVLGVTEKPPVEEAKSQLMIPGRYILSPETLSKLDYDLSLTLDSQAKEDKVDHADLSRLYLRHDIGTREGYLKAQMYFSKKALKDEA